MKLEWSLNLPATFSEISLSRGNRPYASFDLKENWLSKEAFLHFTGMRQFPNMVLRKLCIALETDSLPLHHDFVQSLFRQSLFQVGELEVKTGKVQYNHRRDFDAVRSTCSAILGDLCDTYAEKHSTCKALVILSELVCYFESILIAQEQKCKHEMCDLRSIAKNLASKAMNLGIEKDEEITKVEPEFVPSFRSKQVLFFRIAILCLIHCHDLTSEEVRIILKCAVRSKNVFVEDDGDLCFRDQLRDSCNYFMTNRLDSFLSAIMNDYAILTEALRTTVETAPTI